MLPKSTRSDSIKLSLMVFNPGTSNSSSYLRILSRGPDRRGSGFDPANDGIVRIERTGDPYQWEWTNFMKSSSASCAICPGVREVRGSLGFATSVVPGKQR